MPLYFKVRLYPLLCVAILFQGCFDGTWDEFFQLIKDKQTTWGDYFEHNVAWYQFNKNRENSLILKYEDMKQDHKGHVIKLASFLGYKLSDEQVDLVVENSSFSAMAKKDRENEGPPGWRADRSRFVRKGVVGDWVNHYTEDQSKYVDEMIQKYLEPLGITFNL